MVSVRNHLNTRSNHAERILVTGAAGFIGSNVCLALQEAGNEVIALDNFSVGEKENLKEFEGRIINADIMDFDWASEKVDAIIHEAAITDTTVKDRALMLAVNTEAFKRLAGHCLRHSINLVYASSAAVYGRGKVPMQENQEKDILSHYAESKLEMDNFAAAKFSEFDNKSLKLVGLRYFNVYGPREAGKMKTKMASMVWQLYSQMKQGQRPRLFKHGEQTRDQVYVKDAVQATLLGLDAKKNGVYNVGSGKETSFNKVVEELNKHLQADLKAEYIENSHTHFQPRTLADITNTQKFLGYEPEYDIEKGIADYMRFLKINNMQR